MCIRYFGETLALTDRGNNCTNYEGIAGRGRSKENNHGLLAEVELSPKASPFTWHGLR